MRNKRIGCLGIWLGLCLLIFIGSRMCVQAEENTIEKNESKLIYFVYDSSISMIEDNRDWGAQAQYAVKAFCAMTNPEDIIRFYRIDTETKQGKKYNTYEELDNVSEVYDYRKAYGDIIDSIKFDGDNTLETQIVKAINDINSLQFHGEKWVVMFTDGKIEKNPVTEEKYTEHEFYKILENNLVNLDVKFYYVNINAGEEGKQQSDGNIIWYRLADHKDATILDSILTVTEEIYEKRRLPDEILVKEGEQLNISFDIPVSEVMLLSHTSNEEVSFANSTNGAKWSYLLTSKAVGYREKNKSEEEVYGPSGIMLNCDNLLKTNNHNNGSTTYDLEVTLPEADITSVVYYTPDVELKIVVTRESDTENIVKKDKYIEGEYQIGINLLDEKTNKDVSNSELLQGETYSIKVNGQEIASDLSINERITYQFDEGEYEIYAETSWGVRDEFKIIVEDNLENYTLELDTKDTTFYYNKLEKKEECVIVRLEDNNGNVIDGFAQMTPKIKFYQDKKLCKDMEYEANYEDGAWKIYPLLKEDAGCDISGDLECMVTITVDSEYYKEPFIYENTVTLDMDVEDGLFDIQIKDKVEGEWKLLVPIFSAEVPVTYTWNGEALKGYEIENPDTTIEIIYDKGENEIKIYDTQKVEIWGKLKHFCDFPTEIKVTVSASYTAFGKTYELNESPKTILIEEVSIFTKFFWGTVMLVIILFFFWCIINLAIVVRWRIKKRHISLKPKVGCRYVNSAVETDAKISTKHEWFFVFFKDYYFKITIEILGKELILIVKDMKNTYRICLQNSDDAWNLYANGKKITRRDMILHKSVNELQLEVPEMDVRIIKIQFGGEG